MCGGEPIPIISDTLNLQDDAVSLTEEEEKLLYLKGQMRAQQPCTCKCSCKGKREPDPESGISVEESEVKLKREIDLVGATMVILGSQIGSGIFISPKGVLQNAGSIGMSMIIWSLAGIISLIGALCYAEVGTLIPKSGGEYPILRRAYKSGNTFSFMFAWTCATILKPSSFAILTLTFAKYVLSMLPEVILSEKVLALICIWFIVFLNSYSVRLTQKFMKFFGYGKLVSIGIIVAGGITLNIMGKANPEVFLPVNAFSNGTMATNGTSSMILGDLNLPQLSALGLGLYQGLWAYDGWNQLNYVSEELKNPGKNLPRAIIIAMGLVTFLYLLTNYSYLSVLGMSGLLEAETVGTSFARKVLPGLDRFIPLMVAASVFDTATISCFAASRIPFAAARDGEFPRVLSMIHKKRLTPVPSVILNGIIATIMIFPNDFNSLVNYFSFCMWLFYTITAGSVIVLRKKMPLDQHPRLFKVPIILPYIIVLIGIYLISVPFLQEFDLGYFFAIGWIFFGLILKFIIDRVNIFQTSLEKLTIFLERKMNLVPQED